MADEQPKRTSSGGERSSGSIPLLLPVFSPGMVTTRFLRSENVAQFRPLSTTIRPSLIMEENDLRVLFTMTYRNHRGLVVVPCAYMPRPIEKSVGEKLVSVYENDWPFLAVEDSLPPRCPAFRINSEDRSFLSGRKDEGL